MGELYPTQRWTVGEWLFTEIDGRQIHESYEGRKLYGFSAAGEAPGAVGRIREWFDTLEHAMAAAIAEKHTGPRGAGGTGVGTAADWFMRMIGVGQLQEAGRDGRNALQDALSVTAKHNGPIYRRAQALETELENQGYVIARAVSK